MRTNKTATFRVGVHFSPAPAVISWYRGNTKTIPYDPNKSPYDNAVACLTANFASLKGYSSASISDLKLVDEWDEVNPQGIRQHGIEYTFKVLVSRDPGPGRKTTE